METYCFINFLNMKYFFILLLPFFSCNAQTVSTQNGLIAAIQSAKLNGGSVNIFGEILITQEIEIDFDCVINGGTLKTNDSTAAAFNLFEVKKGGKLTCNNLTVAGPIYAGGTTENVPFTTAFFMDGGAQLILNDCSIKGKFHNTISKTSTGDSVGLITKLRLINCELSSYAQCISFFTVNGNTTSFIDLHGVRFLKSGIPAANNGGAAYGHTLYIHPSVVTNIDNCECAHSERNCVAYYSGGAINTPGKLNITNCRFLEGCKGAIVADTYGSATIENCTFYGFDGVRMAKGDFIVSNNYFYGNASNLLIATIGDISSANIKGNEFKPSFIPNYFGYAMLSGLHKGKYNYSNNTFLGVFSSGSNILNLSNTDAVFRVTENSFFCNPTYAVRADRGLFLVTDNLYIGPTVNVHYNPYATKYVKDGN